MFKQHHKSEEDMPARRAARSDFLLEPSDDDSTCVISEDKLAHLLDPEQPHPTQRPGPKAIETAVEEGGRKNRIAGSLHAQDSYDPEGQGVSKEVNGETGSQSPGAPRTTWRPTLSPDFRKNVYRMPVVLVAFLAAASVLFILTNL